MFHHVNVSWFLNPLSCLMKSKSRNTRRRVIILFFAELPKKHFPVIISALNSSMFNKTDNVELREGFLSLKYDIHFDFCQKQNLKKFKFCLI